MVPALLGCGRMRGSLYRQSLSPLSERLLLEGLFGKQFCGTVLRRNRRALIIWNSIFCIYARFIASRTTFNPRHGGHFFGLASSRSIGWSMLNILYDICFDGRGLRFLSFVIPVSSLIVENSGQETAKQGRKLLLTSWLRYFTKEFVLPDEDRNFCFISKKGSPPKSEALFSCRDVSLFSEVDEFSLWVRLSRNCPLYSQARQNNASQSHSRP